MLSYCAFLSVFWTETLELNYSKNMQCGIYIKEAASTIGPFDL